MTIDLFVDALLYAALEGSGPASSGHRQQLFMYTDEFPLNSTHAHDAFNGIRFHCEQMCRPEFETLHLGWTWDRPIYIRTPGCDPVRVGTWHPRG